MLRLNFGRHKIINPLKPFRVAIELGYNEFKPKTNKICLNILSRIVTLLHRPSRLQGCLGYNEQTLRICYNRVRLYYSNRGVLTIIGRCDHVVNFTNILQANLYFLSPKE